MRLDEKIIEVCYLELDFGVGECNLVLLFFKDINWVN